MRFLRFIYHIIKSVYKNTSKVQFILIMFLIITNLLIGLITFIKVVLPFTYVAI